MWNESRVKPLEESSAIGGASTARELVAGTVARGEPAPDDPLVDARPGGKLATRFPFPITQEVLERGQERFNIYCAPCHGRLGDGEGMIVKRGFPHPPDYAIARIRRAPVGHFYDVITNGYGVMYPYASRVAPADRWAIAAYIRALQASRPEVPRELYREQRLRARETGIGVRPVREPPAGEEGPPAPEGGPSTDSQGPAPTEQRQPGTDGQPPSSAPQPGR